MNKQQKKIAVIQMVSSHILEENLKIAKKLIHSAKDEGAEWIVLPEYWPLMGIHDTDKLIIKESYQQGKLQDFLGGLARELGLVIFGGSLSLDCGEPNRVYNSFLVFNRDGKIISRYDKRNLFEYENLAVSYQESDTIKPGNHVEKIVVDGFKIVQAICFDVRFPEFFRQQLPFDVIVLPAAFTYETGQAHWEILLKARAIENQCYVLASAQGGKHTNGRKTFGHSMIIDPWGNVLNQLNWGNGLIIADINSSILKEVRQKLPVLR